MQPKTLQKVGLINGRGTELLITDYDNRYFIICTQHSKMNTLIQVKQNDYLGTDLNFILGNSYDEYSSLLEIYTTKIADLMFNKYEFQRKPLLFSWSLFAQTIHLHQEDFPKLLELFETILK